MSQLAEILGMSVQTVRQWRWRYKSGLPLNGDVARLCDRFTNIGRKVVIDSGDVEIWLAEKKGKIRRVNYPGTPRSELTALAKGLADEARQSGAELAAQAFELGVRLLDVDDR